MLHFRTAYTCPTVYARVFSRAIVNHCRHFLHRLQRRPCLVNLKWCSPLRPSPATCIPYGHVDDHGIVRSLLLVFTVSVDTMPILTLHRQSGFSPFAISLYPHSILSVSVYPASFSTCPLTLHRHWLLKLSLPLFCSLECFH